MQEGSVVTLPRPGASIADDPLLAVLRDGARRMLMQTIEAEVESFLVAHAELVDEQGRRRLVRNGHAPERQIQTGIGPIRVRRPKVRDRGATEGGEPIRFTSAILPAYLRRTKNLEELLPWLYLKGVSTGQFAEALTALLGPDDKGFRRPRCGALPKYGRRSMSAGRSVTSRPGGMSTSGPMASTSSLGWNTSASACSC